MEVVGLTASLGQLIQITAKTIKYLNSVKEASKDRANLFQEASSLLPLMVSLQAQVNEAKQSEPWFHEVQLLGVENGPLDQLQEALVQLTAKLKPKQGIDKAARAFTWTFDKAYCESVLHKIERVKSRTALALQRGTFKLAQAIKSDTTGIDERVAAVAGNIEALQNFFKTQHDVFARRQEGTGQWLIDSPAFRAWLSGPDRTLCCPGIPGAGKTISASMIINTLRTKQRKTSDSVGVAAIYCNFKEREMQSPHNLLAAACAQLIQDSMQPLPDTLMRLHERHKGSKTKPSWEEIGHVFDGVVRSCHTVYIVVDAIDECSEEVRNVLIPGLKAVPENVRILITTRPIHEITRLFPLSPNLEIRATEYDLTKYITSRIASNPRLARHVGIHPTLEERVCTQIKAKADGIFLSAKLHVDTLSTKTSVKSLKKALDNLPSTLHELYDDALHRINSQSQDDIELAEKALRWVAYAYRPLSTMMLQEAVAIDSEESDYDAEAIPLIGLILDVCSGLLIVDEEVDVVRLVHYTAQDYFNALVESRYLGAHASIAGECLTYLNYDSLQAGSDDSSTSQSGSDYSSSSLLADHLNYDFQLLAYASTFWTLHAKAKPPGLKSQLETQIREFLQNDPYVIFMSIYQYDSSSQPQVAVEDMERCKGYGVAAFFGLCDSLQDLLPNVDNIDAFVLGTGASDERCSLTALHLAATGNQALAIEVLLENGADIECTGSPAYRPLLLAIMNGALAAATALVARGADVMPFDCNRLYESCQLGQWSSPIPFLECLVNAGAKISKMDLYHISPLMDFVTHNKDIETARWLFDHATPPTLDSKEEADYPSAFLTAVADGRIGIVNIFLEYGVDSIEGTMGEALYTAISFDRPEIALALLRRGLDSIEGNMEVMLYMAINSGQNEVALALLQRDIDVDYPDESGWTALHWASAKGHPRIVEELTRRNATVGTKSAHTMAMLYPELDPSPLLNYPVFPIQCSNAIKATLIQREAFTNPSGFFRLYPILFGRNSTVEWRAFSHGMTALDIAIIRKDEEIIRLLKPLTNPIEEENAPSFEQYLCEVFKLSTIDEVRSKLESITQNHDMELLYGLEYVERRKMLR